MPHRHMQKAVDFDLRALELTRVVILQSFTLTWYFALSVSLDVSMCTRDLSVRVRDESQLYSEF
jgi:hypothetical protein